jgi:hypothetical protein
MIDLIQRMQENGGIYGYMYVGICSNNSADIKRYGKVIFIKSDELKIQNAGFLYMWGWPGPDFNFYRFDDYGKTWAFSRNELPEDNRW